METETGIQSDESQYSVINNQGNLAHFTLDTRHRPHSCVAFIKDPVYMHVMVQGVKLRRKGLSKPRENNLLV